MKALPPKWAERFINWLTDSGAYDDIPGDLYEEFNVVNEKRGIRFAKTRYIWTVLRCFRPFILKEKFKFFDISFGFTLLKNYWSVSSRLLIRNKLYTFIIIIGLAIGLASSLVLLIYVSNELSYDKFHSKHDSIYRILVTTVDDEGASTDAVSLASIAPAIKSELPSVKEYVRFSYPGSGFISVEETKVNFENGLYTDPSLFRIFDFSLLKGNPALCLTRPYSVLLTPEIAQSLFGDENPMGKSVYLNGEKPYLVTGIIKSPPSNSQIQFSLLASFATLEREGLSLGWNGGWNYFSYIMLESAADKRELLNKFPDLMYRHINKDLENINVKLSLDLQPLSDAHLGSAELYSDWETKGNSKTILLFAAIAFIILLMGSVNFINLTAAQGSSRLKEIGVRKAIGAQKIQMIKQFLFESFLYTCIATIVAILILFLSSDILQKMIGYGIDEIYLSNLSTVLILLAVIIGVSILSGVYPAFYLTAIAGTQSSAINPKHRPSRISFITTFQFLISIILISSTWYIYNQMQYVQNQNIGYQKENKIIIQLSSENSSRNIDNFKQQILRLPEVTQIGASSNTPDIGFALNGYVPEGKENPTMIRVLDIDDTYLETMGLAIIEGRGFSDEIQSDESAYLVNNALVKKMGWDVAVGKIIQRNGKHEVIGVVKDFNYTSLHSKIEPLIFTNLPWRGLFDFLTVQIESKNLPATIENLEDAWKSVNPDDPFEFHFLDVGLAALYNKEQAQAQLLLIFSALAILIGVLGLFGHVSLSLKQKTKELGVRRVLGANTSNLLIGVSLRYVLSILIASIIALPIVFYWMTTWFNNFFYRANLNPVIFVLAVLVCLIIALLTINIQTLNVVKKNPTESLKYE